MDSLVVNDSRKQRLIIFSISFASFMVNLDTYIVNISLPAISRSFHIGTSEVSWVVLSYLLTVTCTLLIFGKLGDKIGLKKVFIYGFNAFTIGSLLCGLSPSLPWLVAGRCIQGIGASILYAMSPAMIPKFLPENIRGSAFGILSTIAALGITIGTPIGGIITGYLSWNWIFLINIPFGIAAVIMCGKIIPDDHKAALQTEKKSGFDISGAILSFVGSLFLILALNMGQELGWTSFWILTFFASSFVTLGIFIYWEGKTALPLLDLSLFKDKAFTYGNLASFLATAFLAGNNFLMPFYLILVKGLKSQEAGLMIMIYSVVYMFMGFFAGKTADKINPRILCTVAMAVGIFTSFIFSFSLNVQNLIPVIIYQVMLAITYALFFPSNNNVVMAMAPPGKQGIVSGVFRMVNRLGMACGVCIFETIFAYAAIHSNLLTNSQSYAILPKEILAAGFHNAYFAGGLFFIVAFLFSLIAKSKEKVPVKTETEASMEGLIEQKAG